MPRHLPTCGTGPLCRDCERIVARRQHVAKMTREGLSTSRIAELLRVTNRIVQRDKVALGISQPPPTHFVPIEHERFLQNREERRERVAQLTRAGLSASQIAEKLKVNERMVQRDRVALKIGRPAPVPLTPEEQQRALQMLQDGYPYTEVARTLGRHDTTIAKRYPGMSQVNGGQFARLNDLKRRLGLL